MTDYLKYLNDRAIAMGYIGEELDEQSALNWIANAWSLDVNDAKYVLKRDLDFELDKKADKEHTYTMDEMDIQLDEKADKSNTYTKKEVDDAISASTGGSGGVTEDKVKELIESETTPKFDLKADKSDTYTKQEVDDKVAAGGGGTVDFPTEQGIHGASSSGWEKITPNNLGFIDIENQDADFYQVAGIGTMGDKFGYLKTWDISNTALRAQPDLGFSEVILTDGNGKEITTYTGSKGSGIESKDGSNSVSLVMDATSGRVKMKNSVGLDSNILVREDVYGKSEIDYELGLKADKADTYTKTEVNDLVDQGAIGLPLEQGLHGVTPNGYEKITPNSMGYGPAHDWSWELAAVSGDKFGKMEKWGINYHALWCDSPTSTLQLGPYDNSLQIGGFGSNGTFGMISDFGDDKLSFYMNTKLGVLEMAGTDGVKKRILTKGDTYETHETYTKDEVDAAVSSIPVKEKFTDLGDTPSRYHPNKLVGYNLAGDALIPVDKLESFTQLNDVPDTFVGNARKVPMVRPDETGMDFVDLPSVDLSGIESRLGDVEDKNDAQDIRLDAQSLRIDQLEISPKITKFNELADTPNDYRPGRILAYNMDGDGITSVAPFNHLTALDDTPSSYSGQKRKALVVKEDETGTEFASMPDLGPINTDIANLENEIVRLDNEQYIQDQSTEALEAKVDLLEDWKSKIDSADSSIKIDSRVVNKPSEVKDGAFTAAEINLKDVVIVRGTTARTVTMPEVITATATSTTSTQTRVGREIKISNYSSQQLTVNTTSSQKFVKWDGTTVNTHIVPAGKTVVLNAIYWNGTSSGFAWAITRYDYSSGGSSSADEWISKVESGDSSAKVNSNNIFGSMQIKDGNLTANELATCSAGYIIGSTARTATLPKVVDVNVSSIGAGEARFGKQMKIVNMSTRPLTVNVRDSGRIYTSGTVHATSVTVAVNAHADFHAVWWPGGNYNQFCWVMTCGS